MRAVKERHVTVDELQKLGYPVIRGSAYIPKAWLPKQAVSLAVVRRRLAKIKGSLARTVADIRDQEG